jgi:EmrB/QacA subfamily drug resistance transporter
LATALAMIVLDGTIVSVALPSIIADLHLSLTEAQWVNSLYSVVFAALLITAGRIGDRIGRRRILLVGVAVFVIGSVFAGLADNSSTLLASRALQGIGGAMVLPSTLATVNATFRGRDRATAFGVWGAVMSGAAALGPLLGGLLTTVGRWPLIFWVNLPIGIAVLVAAVRLVDETRTPRADARQGIDVLGPLLSAAGLGLIIFGLIEGSTLGWWRPQVDSPSLVGIWPATAPISATPVLLLLGLLLMAAFIGWQVRRRNAGRATTLDPGLFRIGSFGLGNTVAGAVAVGEFALLFVLPLYLEQALRLTTLRAGLVLAAMAGGAFVSGAVARHLAAAIGPTKVVIVGLALEVAGAGVTAGVVSAGGVGWGVVLTLLPYGLGLGLASAQLTSVTLRDVPTTSSGIGSATQSTVRQLGAALGTAAGGAVLTGKLGSSSTFLATDPSRFAAAAGSALVVAMIILAAALVLAGLLDRRDRSGHTPRSDP